MNAFVAHRPALLLNADYRPISYFPLSLWPWQETIKAVFLDRVNIVSFYADYVHSPSVDMQLPSVIALKAYIQPAQSPAFTRFNVFLRDEFRCQYCGSQEELTFDHVNPRRMGGLTCWENIVTACSSCNLAKGGRTPRQAGLLLKREPFKPTSHHLQEIGRRFPPRQLHPTWQDFLYFDNDTLTQEAARKAAVLKPTFKGGKKRKVATESAFPEDMSYGQYWSVELDT